MKVLLDHDLPKRLRLLFRGHLALTAKQMGWHELSNGRLISAAEAQQFDVLITADKKMYEQQQHLDRKIGLVVLSTSLMVYLEPGFPLVVAAIRRVVPASFEAVEIPKDADVQNRIGGV